MLRIFDERLFESPFVDAIWHGRTENAGSRIASAGSCWVMLIERDASRGKPRLSIVGPMTKALPMPYTGDTEFLAIKFKPGTFMPHLPASQLIDAIVAMPEATSKSFWFNGSAWQFPDYENANTFVDRLVREGLLLHDDVVDAVLQEQPLDLSPCSVQRRFVHVTGLTQSSIRQIARARKAMTLLQNGASIIDTVYEVGYTDQPHMTKSLKYLIGQTPAQIVRTSQNS